MNVFANENAIRLLFLANGQDDGGLTVDASAELSGREGIAYVGNIPYAHRAAA